MSLLLLGFGRLFSLAKRLSWGRRLNEYQGQAQRQLFRCGYAFTTKLRVLAALNSQGEPVLEARFYETCYFCNVVRNVLHDQFSYIRNLNNFYCDERIFYLVSPFQKYSVFHEFIEFIVEDIYYEEASNVGLEDRRELIEKFKDIPSAINDMKPQRLPIEQAFEFHDIECLSFESHLESVGKSFLDASEDDVYDYMGELRLSGDYEMLVQQTVKEVFHVLFQNRSLLMIFNQMMAGELERQVDIEPQKSKILCFPDLVS
ncbi:hypothetical protein [Halomonas sp. SpR8]|uniref:hypothetical protein n=1 Tax=Halomonas sp. SpR8 TaxID=3050463 RepID=UPI0027E47BF3|nr:hypothetical protein [Halomonas sp. SpR8]MDQ7729931.1 hypothetical protein [Halomonas sp. SpR8]